MGIPYTRIGRLQAYATGHPEGVSAVLATAITAPLAGLALRADERYKIYLFGSDYARDPLGVIRYPIDTIDGFLSLGNFRPFGRLVEHAQFYLSFETVHLAGIPTHIANGLWRTLAVALTAATLAWYVGRFFLDEPHQGRPYQVLVGALFAATLVGAGNVNTLVMFTSLYFAAPIIVLLVSGSFLTKSPSARHRNRPLALVGYAVAGAVCASYNELTYFVVPLATLTLLFGALSGERGPSLWERVRGTGKIGAWLALVGGFFAVFIPVRTAIYIICSRPDASCYVTTNITLENWSLGLLANRALSGVPLVGWRTETAAMQGYAFSPLVTAVIAGAGLLTALAIAAAEMERRNGVAEIRTSTLRTVGITLVGVTAVLLAATLASLSPAVQEGVRFGTGWRETPITLVGTALIGTGVYGLLRERLAARRAMRAGVGLVGVAVIVVWFTASMTMSYNVRRVMVEGQNPANVVHNEIAASVATFDETDGADARRCELEARTEELVTEILMSNLRNGLDAVAQQRAGVPYCSER